MKPLEHTLLPQTHIVDVSQFFVDITEAYVDFEASVLLLLREASEYSPNKILFECGELKKRRVQLAIMDEKMFAIIQLTRDEIVDTAMIQDYRVAFAKASMACNNLHQKLLAIRATLQEAALAM